MKLENEPWRAENANMEAQRLKIEPCRVCRPVVTDSHHFDKEQDPYPE